MRLLDLPVELILEIADQIDQEGDILAFIKSCRCLHNILISYLYRRNAISSGSALPWSSEHGFERNVEQMLLRKVDPETPRRWKDASITRYSHGNFRVNSSLPFYRACNSPLYLAAQRGHESIVKLLLQYKVDLSLPLVVAASEGSYDPPLVSPPTREIFQRVPERYERIVRLLLEHGANPNSMAPTNLTALALAIRSKNLGIVSLLLKYGAELDYPGDISQRGRSWTPPMYVFLYAIDGSLHNHGLSIAEPLLGLLVKHGVDINSPDYHGVSPIHLASQRDPTGSLVRQMIRHGADVNSRKPGSGSTPLHFCTEAAAIALLESGARIDIADRKGDTPLHCTTNIKLQRLYLDAGADPNWKNHNGESVLVRVAGKASFKVMDLLLERGADINSTTIHRETALHRAVRYVNIFNVKWLLDHGANVNAELDTGATPLDCVRERAYSRYWICIEIEKFLLSRGGRYSRRNKVETNLVTHVASLARPHSATATS